MVIDTNNNCLIQHGYYLKTEKEFIISDIYQKNVKEEYYLSETALQRIYKRAKIRKKGIANTLSTQTPGKKRCADGTVIEDQNGIRDLTEIESERLQGFPDNWTKYGDYNGIIKEVPKSARYFMCGNAVTSLLVKEIGLKIKLF